MAFLLKGLNQRFFVHRRTAEALVPDQQAADMPPVDSVSKKSQNDRGNKPVDQNKQHGKAEVAFRKGKKAKGEAHKKAQDREKHIIKEAPEALKEINIQPGFPHFPVKQPFRGKYRAAPVKGMFSLASLGKFVHIDRILAADTDLQIRQEKAAEGFGRDSDRIRGRI